MRTYLVTTLAAATLILSACSGSDNSGASPTSSSAASASETVAVPYSEPDPSASRAPEGAATEATSLPAESIDSTVDIPLAPSDDSPALVRQGEKYACSADYTPMPLIMDGTVSVGSVEFFTHTIEDGSQSLFIEFSGGPNPIVALVVNDIVPVAVTTSDPQATAGQMRIDGNDLGLSLVRFVTACVR